MCPRAWRSSRGRRRRRGVAESEASHSQNRRSTHFAAQAGQAPAHVQEHVARPASKSIASEASQLPAKVAEQVAGSNCQTFPSESVVVPPSVASPYEMGMTTKSVLPPHCPQEPADSSSSHVPTPHAVAPSGAAVEPDVPVPPQPATRIARASRRPIVSLRRTPTARLSRPRSKRGDFIATAAA